MSTINLSDFSSFDRIFENNLFVNFEDRINKFFNEKNVK